MTARGYAGSGVAGGREGLVAERRTEAAILNSSPRRSSPIPPRLPAPQKLSVRGRDIAQPITRLPQDYSNCRCFVIETISLKLLRQWFPNTRELLHKLDSKAQRILLEVVRLPSYATQNNLSSLFCSSGLVQHVVLQFVCIKQPCVWNVVQCFPASGALVIFAGTLLSIRLLRGRLIAQGYRRASEPPRGASAESSRESSDAHALDCREFSAPPFDRACALLLPHVSAA